MRTHFWLAGLAILAAVTLAGCEAILEANPLAGLQPTAIPTGFTPSTLPPGGSIQGRVWHDLCSIWGELPADVGLPAGCAADGRGGYRANGRMDPGEPDIGGVRITLGQGLCPAAAVAETTTSADGSYRFGGLTAGSYCVSLDPLGELNNSILQPGGWTYPLAVDGTAAISVVLSSDEVSQELDFGWDYELLPVSLGPLPSATPTPTPSQSPTPTPSPTRTPTLTATRTSTPASYPNWKGEYFANRTLSGTSTVVRNDKAVDFDWGSGTPAPGLPADSFSVRWTQVTKFSKGTYRFTLRVDDGVRLFVDGKKILDKWQDGSVREYTVDRAMDGSHTIVVEYYEHTGKALIKVSWNIQPTPTATLAQTTTPTPTSTSTPTPTSTLGSTDTDTPTPTNTLEPTATDTDTPTPTDEPTPEDTETTPP